MEVAEETEITSSLEKSVKGSAVGVSQNESLTQTMHDKEVKLCRLRNNQGPVAQKSRNFLGLFRLPEFPFFLRNAEALSHQTFQSSLFFLD